MDSRKKRKCDNRSLYTRSHIKDTVYDLLRKKSFSSITITELCRRAGINRGTFYIHYIDMDDLLDDLLADIMEGTSPVIDHVFCTRKAECVYPFCDKLRSDERYSLLFRDILISERLIVKLADFGKENYISRLMSGSRLSRRQAEAVFSFQMNGCLIVNKMMLNSGDKDWKEVQAVIDEFIRGGLENIINHPTFSRQDPLPETSGGQ